MQNLNFEEIYSKIEFEFSRQKKDYWELDYLNKNPDFATVWLLAVCIIITTLIYDVDS